MQVAAFESFQLCAVECAHKVFNDDSDVVGLGKFRLPSINDQMRETAKCPRRASPQRAHVSCGVEGRCTMGAKYRVAEKLLSSWEEQSKEARR